MNRKGFTLIELLATIIIIAIIGGIATTGIISVINTSKLKSEKIFVDKLANLIDDYLALNPQTIGANETYSINISDLIEAKLVAKEDLINPKNKEQCFATEDPEIKLYKDSNYVYYYYVDLSGSNTDCNISDENAIIDTFTDAKKAEAGLS